MAKTKLYTIHIWLFMGPRVQKWHLSQLYMHAVFESVMHARRVRDLEMSAT